MGLMPLRSIPATTLWSPAKRAPARSTHIAVERFTSAGAVDASFGNASPTPNGVFLVTGGATDEANAVAVDASNHVVVVGQAISTGRAEMLVLNSNASNTAPFTGSRFSLTAVGSSGQPNLSSNFGKWCSLVAGTADGNFVTAKVTSSGTLDSGFGSGRKVETVFAGSAEANSLAVQANGKIVVAGFEADPSEKSITSPWPATASMAASIASLIHLARAAK